jgi:hypothetical protein
MPTACFLITPGNQAKRTLRRYSDSLTMNPPCPSSWRSYHNASVEIGDFPVVRSDHGSLAMIDPVEYAEDERWPVKCEHCEYIFTADDHWQVNQDLIYAAEDGREMTLSAAPPGAVWVAEWMPDRFRINGSGPPYVIRLPNGHDFMPGSGASNCDRKGEDHDCWCVHGEAPNFTIDKNPEPGRSTCTAGGGSVWSHQGQPDEWHGHINSGVMTP